MRTTLPKLIRTLFIIFCLNGLILSSACSQGGLDSTQPALHPTTSGQTNVQKEGEVVISFAANEYQRSLYEPLIEEFNQQNPGIIVQFVPLPQLEPGELLEEADWYRMLASAADTTLTYGVWSVGSGVSAYFSDLVPLIDQDPAFATEDFWPGALDACGDQEGHILGVPLLVNISGIFFDEEAFDAAGLARPAPGWTWEDFRESATVLAQKNGDGIRYGYVERSYLFTSIMAPIVGAYLDHTGGEVDAQVLQSELEWYLDLVEQHAINPMRGVEEQDQQQQLWQDFFKGDNPPAMWPGYLAEFIPGATVSMDSEDPFAGMAIDEYGFAPFPVNGDGSGGGASLASLTCGAISAGSQHPQAAWEWLSFLSQQWLLRDRSAWEITQAPSRPSVADRVGFWNNLPENVVPGVRFALNHAWFGSLYPGTFEAIDAALTEAVRGENFATVYENLPAESPSIPEPTADNAEIVVATPPAPPPTGVTVINYYYDGLNSPYGGDIKSLTEDFNQSHPDLFVKVSGFDNPSENQDWLAYLAKKYDCFSWYSASGNQSTDSLLSLNSLFESEGPNFTQDYPPILLDEYRVDGNLVGLPTSSQPQIMAYNADLLAKRGLTAPPNGWTFDDFIQMATAASSTADGETSYGFVTNAWDPFLLEGQGIPLSDPSPDSTQIDTPEMLSGLTWIEELVKSGVVLVQGRDNWQEVNQAVASGQVAFWKTMVDTPVEYLNPGDEPGYSIKFAPLPAIRDQNSVIYAAITRANYISAQTSNPQACWTWIKFLSEQPGAYPGVPARLSVASSPAWTAQVGEQNADVYRFAFSHLTPTSELSGSISILQPLTIWMNRALTAVLNGEAPEQALSAAQAKADTYLACVQPVETAGMNDEDLRKEILNCLQQSDPNWGG